MTNGNIVIGCQQYHPYISRKMKTFVVTINVEINLIWLKAKCPLTVIDCIKILLTNIPMHGGM